MLIALTNDDGIHAPGLRAIYRVLKKAGHTVQVIAPLTEQSAVGHSITVLNPLRVKQIADDDFEGLAIGGTPTDCVKLGLNHLMPQKPDLLISGINSGGNVGPDILYSGTVAAATEAAHMGYPALAVSYDSFKPTDMSGAAEFAVALLPKIPWSAIPARRVLNLNLPSRPLAEYKGLKICPQTSVVWQDWHHRREDPRGGAYWWLDGRIPMDQVEPGTDKYWLADGWATLTPLRFDFTDKDTISLLDCSGMTE